MGGSRQKKRPASSIAVPSRVKRAAAVPVLPPEPKVDVAPVETLWPPPADAGLQWLQSLAHWAHASE